MDPAPSIVNCGRCAHLHNRGRGSRPGEGKCACTARMRETGKIHPTVQLDFTCEHAQLSARFDPEFRSRNNASKQGTWNLPPLA